MFKGFRQFILRGNVVELAVGVVVGAAFNGVVNSLVKDFITPLIAAIFRQPDFSRLVFIIHGSIFDYGDLINSVLSFLIVALTVYFFVVVPINSLNNYRIKRSAPIEPALKKCPFCLSEIPREAIKCAHCTADLATPKN